MQAGLYVSKHICFLTYMQPNIINREDILEKLLQALTQRRLKSNYAVIGPRRIGKTAILEELERRLAESDAIVTRIDFSKYGYDPTEFSRVLIDSLTKAYQEKLDPASRVLEGVRHAVAEIKKLRRMRVEFDISLDEAGKPVLTVRPTLVTRELRHAESFEQAFSYASRLASASGKKVIIMLDEAQKIVEWTRLNGMKNVMDLFRSIIDELDEVSVVLSGSRVHMLRNLFAGSGSPLFGRFTLIEVGPLEKRDANTLYLRNALEATENEANKVYQIVGGHPFYLLVMAEARRPRERVAERYRRLLTDVAGGLYLYVNYILREDLGSKITETNYVKILGALAYGERKVSQIAERIGIQAPWLTRYLTRLIEYDLVKKTDGEYELKDQIVNDYFRFNYPEETVSP